MQQPKGKVYVGRRIYEGKTHKDPKLPGCKSIVVMTASTAYGSLNPYEVQVTTGNITTNVELLHQFSKLYETVPATTQRFSRYDPTIIWQWPAERHAIRNADGTMTITPEYYRWREAGMKAPKAIRYPVGFNHRHECICAFANDANGNVDLRPLDYIEARKRIYVPAYSQGVVLKPQFQELQQLVNSGQNILIIEVDGPHQESMPYYKEKYGVQDSFIVNDCILAEPVGLNLLLNDPKHPYGHGYVLASLLM